MIIEGSISLIVDNKPRNSTTDNCLGFNVVMLLAYVEHLLCLACADAYLTLCIKRYVSGFSKGFKNLEVLKIVRDGMFGEQLIERRASECHVFVYSNAACCLCNPMED